MVRALPTFFAASLALLGLAGCAATEDAMPESFVVEIWTDSNPQSRKENHTILLASGVMRPHAEYVGLYSLETPLRAELPSGLAVEVTCERVATGHFHCGMSHGGELAAMGKYAGPFTVRVFPPEHQSYVLDVKQSAQSGGGA